MVLIVCSWNFFEIEHFGLCVFVQCDCTPDSFPCSNIFELNLFFFLVFLVFKLRVYILYGFVVG
jgi:hypothetical protein